MTWNTSTWGARELLPVRNTDCDWPNSIEGSFMCSQELQEDPLKQAVALPWSLYYHLKIQKLKLPNCLLNPTTFSPHYIHKEAGAMVVLNPASTSSYGLPFGCRHNLQLSWICNKGWGTEPGGIGWQLLSIGPCHLVASSASGAATGEQTCEWINGKVREWLSKQLYT